MKRIMTWRKAKFRIGREGIKKNKNLFHRIIWRRTPKESEVRRPFIFASVDLGTMNYLTPSLGEKEER